MDEMNELAGQIGLPHEALAGGLHASLPLAQGGLPGGQKGGRAGRTVPRGVKGGQ